MRVILVLLVAAASVSSAFGQALPPIRDQYPLSLLHNSLRLEEAHLVSTPTIDATFSWSNTLNSRGEAYIVDAETRMFDLKLHYPLLEWLEASLALPFVWRGGGVLDSLIKEWDCTLGACNSARGRTDDDRFQIEGTNQDQTGFALTRQGGHFGDLVLGGKFLLNTAESSAQSALLEVSLPTGAEEYGQENVDVLFSLLAEEHLDAWSLYGGIGASYFGDTSNQGLRYERYRASGFFTTTYDLSESLYLLAGLYSATKLISGVRKLPDYALYLDFGFGVRFPDGMGISCLVRENPVNSKGSTDFSLVLSGRIALFS